MSLLVAVITLALLAAIAGLLLGGATLYCKNSDDPIITSINTLLPQSQCGQCGYPGCRPYAEAVAKGETINKCVPGGRGVVIQIANLLNVEPPPAIEEITEDLKEERPENKITLLTPVKKVALIDESYCIGCTKCLQVCPVDAIIGTTKAMHTVLNDYCTGCELCVVPCPTQCIQMISMEQLAEQRLLEELAAS